MKNYIALIIIILSSCIAISQEEDLLALLGEDEPTIDYISASFKTNRVINLHSLESTAPGVFDFKISHRFGFLSGGFYELFGLDNSQIRLGFEYGLTDRLAIGVGRNSYQKTYDGFAKYKILRQSTGAKKMPVTVALLLATAVNGQRNQNPDRDNLFSSRMFYTAQLIIGRKINNRISLQLSPTLIHRNLVATKIEKNDVYSLAAASRVKINNRLTFNTEYIYVLPNQLASKYRNSFSLGVDIETGGHVFQLHLTNSTSMVEKGFVAETVGNWLDGDIHFGFNISRVFTLVKK